MVDRERDPALDPTLDHVSRRRFIQRAGAGAVATAALGTAAMAQDKTPAALNDASLAHEEVTFLSGKQRVEAFLCRPKAEAGRGGVIVIHEIFGLNDHIRDIACRLAKAGYAGLAVNFFTREGKPPSMEGGFAPLMEFVGRIPDSQIITDITAAAKYLRARKDSNGKVGVVGFCWGGRYAMLAAAEVPNLNAAVAYYGRIRLASKTENQPRSALELVPKMRAPLLGHFGALDQGIPPADAEALRDELKKNGKTAEIYVYEGAGHAFNNDTRESYNAGAAKLAWRRTLDWFGKYLKG
jgi:carboxymethylenebutenolidase